MKSVINRNLIYKYDNLTKIFIILSFALIYFTYVSANFSNIFRGVIFYAVYLFTAALLVLKNQKGNKSERLEKNSTFMINSYFVFIIIYLFEFQFLSNKTFYDKNIFGIAINLNVYQQISITIMLYVVFLMFKNPDVIFFKKLMKIILLFFLFDSILSLIILQVDPKAMRELATGYSKARNDLLGVSSYEVIYSVVILVPAFIYLYNSLNRKKKQLYFLFAILLTGLILKAGYTLAIFATLISICYYIFISIKSLTARILLLCTIGILCVLFFNNTLIYNIFIWISININVEAVSERFRQLANFIMYSDNSGSTLIRLELYRNSWNAFLASPIFGMLILQNPKYILSGHSTILDILGGVGLLGFTPFAIFIHYSYKNAILFFSNIKYKNVIKSSYLTFIIIATVNPIFSSPSIIISLVFVLPILSLLSNNEVTA